MISLVSFYLFQLICLFYSIRDHIVYIFVFYQGYYFLNPKTKWWGINIIDLPYSFISLFILFLYAIVSSKMHANTKITKLNIFWPLMILASCYAISGVYAIDTNVHFESLDALVTAIAVVLLLYKIVSTRRLLHTIVIAYTISASYLGFYIYQFGRNENGRFTGAGMVDSPDQNGIALAIAPALIFSMYYLLFAKNNIIRILYILSGFFLAQAIVIINSRGAFLGIATASIFFVIFLYFSKMRIKNQKKIVILFILFGAISVAIVTDDYFWQRMYSIKTEQSDESVETGRTRVAFWTTALQASSDYPLGMGAYGFQYRSHLYFSDDLNTGSSKNRAVHSTWLEALTEAGFLGFIAFVLIITTTIRNLYKTLGLLKYKHQPVGEYFFIVAILSSFICFIVGMTFMNRLRAEILYWLIAFGSIAYNIYYLQYNDDARET